MPMYIFLNTTAYGKGTAYMPQEINKIIFTIIIVQQPNNVNNLIFITIARPVIILPS